MSSIFLLRYTRKLVDAGNGKFNLLIICWDAGQGSAIHDHTESHCFMRILKGQLREIRYVWPDDYDHNKVEFDQSAHISATHSDDEHDKEYNSSELQELSSCIMETDSLHYINGTCRCSVIFSNIWQFLAILAISGNF